jgi:hypothetical protein
MARWRRRTRRRREERVVFFYYSLSASLSSLFFPCMLLFFPLSLSRLFLLDLFSPLAFCLYLIGLPSEQQGYSVD